MIGMDSVRNESDRNELIGMESARKRARRTTDGDGSVQEKQEPHT